MMVVAGTVRIRSDRRAEAVAVARAMAAATRQEAGCVSYRFAADLDDPDLFCIVEEWESAEALRRHFTTAHMATFQARIPELVAAPPTVAFYEATVANPL